MRKRVGGAAPGLRRLIQLTGMVAADGSVVMPSWPDPYRLVAVSFQLVPDTAGRVLCPAVRLTRLIDGSDAPLVTVTTPQHTSADASPITVCFSCGAVAQSATNTEASAVTLVGSLPADFWVSSPDKLTIQGGGGSQTIATAVQVLYEPLEEIPTGGE